MIRKKCFAITYATLLIILYSHAIFAQNPNTRKTQNADSIFDLHTLNLADLLNIEVLSATKKEESQALAPATIYVITEQDIINNGYIELHEVLENIPGVVPINLDFFAFGGQRGFLSNFSQTLLLIDGREMQNLLAAETFISHQFATHNIRQIEIMQGPASVLYGANALVGIINIITKNGDKKYENIEYKFDIGTENTNAHSLVFGKQMDNLRISGNFRWFKSAMWDFTEMINDSANFRAGYSSDLQNNNINYNNSSQSNFGGIQIQYKDLYIGTSFYQLNQAGGLEYVSVNYSGQQDIRNMQLIYGGYRHSLSKKMKIESEFQFYNESMYAIAFPYNQDIYNTLISNGKVPGSELTDEEILNNFLDVTSQKFSPGSKRYRFNINSYYNLNEKINLTVGYIFDYYDLMGVALSSTNLTPSFNATSSSDNKMRKPYFKQFKNSIFTQYQHTFLNNKIILTAGGRFDYHEYYNGVFTLRGGVVYKPFKNTIGKILFGQAFREPNIFEMGALYPVENLNLKPTKMNTYEFSISQGIGKIIQCQLSGFQNTATDFIEPSNTFVFKNSSQIKKVWGLESLLRTKVGLFAADVGYSYIINNNEKYNDKTIENLGVYKHRLTGSATIKVTKNIYLNSRINYFNKITALHGNPNVNELITIPSYLKIDPTISIQNINISGINFTGSFTVKNVTNQQFYQPNIRLGGPKQFPQPKRQFISRLSFSF